MQLKREFRAFLQTLIILFPYYLENQVRTAPGIRFRSDTYAFEAREGRLTKY